MDAGQLRARQAPLKKLFREDPQAARQTLIAQGTFDPADPIVDIGTYLGSTPAGLHRSTGGDGTHACSAQMLLEALIGCAGVTLAVVAKALSVPLDDAQVRAEGQLDFRGTLGVDRSAPVGFEQIHVVFELSTSADDATLEKMRELTERYCVVLQSLRSPVITRFVRRPIGTGPGSSRPDSTPENG